VIRRVRRFCQLYRTYRDQHHRPQDAAYYAWVITRYGG
jgi:hypothetical protein